MLILTQGRGDTILIGDSIKITTVYIDKASGKIRLGIEAPDDVPILRQEVADRVRREGGDITRRVK